MSVELNHTIIPARELGSQIGREIRFSGAPPEGMNRDHFRQCPAPARCRSRRCSSLVLPVAQGAMRPGPLRLWRSLLTFADNA